MAHEMTIKLTDDEYAALTEEAKLTGQELGELIQEMLDYIVAKHTQSMEKPLRSPSQRKISEILYSAGLTVSMPTGKTLSEEEEAELKRLANRLGAGGKPASEMVIEDRGPY